MKDLIKRILREEVSKRFTKGSSNAQSLIIKHMDKIISNTTRIIPPPEENYGNYGEEWCKGGKAVIEVRYYMFSEDEEEVEKFNMGSLFVDENEVNFLSKILQVRKPFILNVITEWYDEKYATKFGQETGHPEFEIDETIETDSPRKCYQMIDVDSVSNEEMINYLDKETAYRRDEIERFSSGELKRTYRSVYNSRLNNIGNRN
jgi:hypothetical protein